MRSRDGRCGAALLLALACGVCEASGARWVTGSPYFTGQSGVPVGWAKGTVMYATDPADLSGYVSHAAADAMVAAAAGVWSVPVANIGLQQGGVLAEHVSGANVYLGANGLVWPAVVGAVQVAVVYDTDGSVTEALLGGGASGVAECRQNGVTESVDGFDPGGWITHAEVIVNGRCTGAAVEAQMQLQYQLERAFGRVLGLGWSQTNDNVFTGVPVPTYEQALHWPILHPMDIVCGAYTYQCLPEPFVLRPDDVASLVLLYGMGAQDVVPAGKQVSLAAATGQVGTVSFPTGEGMAGVNVLLQRMPQLTNVAEGWVTVSAVSGAGFRRVTPEPVAASGNDVEASSGTYDWGQQGWYQMAYVPMPDGTTQDNHVVTAEPVNALYVGSYSVGPYGLGQVMPSGTLIVPVARYVAAGSVVESDFAPGDAASVCGAGADGTEGLPATVDASGWWDGLLCGYGHTAWWGWPVRANRTWTLDVTAMDTNGIATLGKAMPVLGAWGASDGTRTLPTLGAAVSAFNTTGLGTTRLQVSGAAAGGVRLAVADERGDGRPDSMYRARLLYADTVLPERVAPGGGVVTIAGMGFGPGVAVTVGGVAATLLAETMTTLQVMVPAGMDGAVADVVVSDRATGATCAMSGALTYDGSGALPKVMRLVSAPTGGVFAGEAAGIPFAVQVLQGDGVTPVAGETVTFSASAGSVQFGVCGAATCAVVTDVQGMASSVVVPLAAGGLTAQAVDGGLSEMDVMRVLPGVARLVVVNAPMGGVNVGVQAGLGFAVQALQADGGAAVGVPVRLTTSAGAVDFVACGAPSCTLVTDGNGLVNSNVVPLAAGAVQMVATVDTAVATAGFWAVQPVDLLQVLVAPSTTVNVGVGAALRVGLTASDGVTHLFGRALVFSGPPGVVFDACNASPCTLVTNWSDAGTGVVATVPGTYTVQVQEVSSFGVVSDVVTATFTAVQRGPQLRLVSAPADGAVVGVMAAVPFVVQVVGSDGVTPVNGVAISVGPAATGAATMSLCTVVGAACWEYADLNGMVSSMVTPLVAGPIVLEAHANPLALQTTFRADLSAAELGGLQVVVLSGGGQVASGSAGLGLVLLAVEDATGAPMGGVPVTVYQEVTRAGVVCPVHGRCPAEAVVATGSVTVISDGNGLVSVVPLVWTAGAEVTHMAATVGTAGFVATDLSWVP